MNFYLYSFNMTLLFIRLRLYNLTTKLIHPRKRKQGQKTSRPLGQSLIRVTRCAWQSRKIREKKGIGKRRAKRTRRNLIHRQYDDSIKIYERLCVHHSAQKNLSDAYDPQILTITMQINSHASHIAHPYRLLIRPEEKTCPTLFSGALQLDVNLSAIVTSLQQRALF